MSNAIVDPEQLGAYQRELALILNDLAIQMSSLEGEFSELGENWRDEKYVGFAKTFEETRTLMNSFFREGDVFLDHLRQKEKAIREYLETGSY